MLLKEPQFGQLMLAAIVSVFIVSAAAVRIAYWLSYRRALKDLGVQLSSSSELLASATKAADAFAEGRTTPLEGA